MNTSTFQDLISFDDFSATPKYRQLVNSILKAIEDCKLQVNDNLPSILELSYKFDICRQTVEKGYQHLKQEGIIGSVPGKGYYVRNCTVDKTKKVLLLFNKISQHKKILYDAIVSTLGNKAVVDFYVYNNDLTLFRKFLENSRDDYHSYVVLPHFIEGGETAHHLINTIPKDKLVLLDKVIPGITGEYNAVFENFEEDIYQALQQALTHLEKYHTLKLVFPENSYYPKEIIKGFILFCKDYAFNDRLVHDISTEPLNIGEVYLTLQDEDLVPLSERILASGLQPGENIGIISYNETPLKKIIFNGITTISTDFEAMGRETANVILEKTKGHIQVPFSFTLRSSL